MVTEKDKQWARGQGQKDSETKKDNPDKGDKDPIKEIEEATYRGGRWRAFTKAAGLDEPQSPQSPVDFKVSGHYDINQQTQDLQEQQRQAKEEAQRNQEATAIRLEKTEKERDEARQDLYKEKVDGLKRDFDTKMEQLRQDIQKGVSQKGFKEQYEEIFGMAKELGLEKTTAGRDPMVDLEIAKLDHEDKRAERQFRWQMRQDEKHFQLELEKMKGERDLRRQELEQQAKRDEIFTSWPDRIGSAIVKGMADEEERQPERITKSYHIEIDQDVGGEIDCPHCQGKGTQSIVAIGPTSKTAACTTCGARFEVKRKRVPSNEEA